MTPPAGATMDLHDQVIRQNCRTLKTPAIAAQYQGLAEAAAREGYSHVRYLDALLGAEIDERERKAVLRRVKEARLPRLKTLQEFDFAQSPVAAARMANLAGGSYIARAEPVLLIGEAGTGKTHLASGLCVAACEQRRRVRFTTAAALVNELVEARAANTLSRALGRWERIELIGIDELGYVPLAELARCRAPVPGDRRSRGAGRGHHHHQPAVLGVGAGLPQPAPLSGAGRPADRSRAHHRDRQ
jgi:DNA replication protein DnaC